MLDPLSRQIFDAIRYTPDFYRFHEYDQPFPGLPGRTVGELEPQLQQLTDMKLIVRGLVVPEQAAFNLIQIANPAKNPQTMLLMQRYGLLDN